MFFYSRLPREKRGWVLRQSLLVGMLAISLAKAMLGLGLLLQLDPFWILVMTTIFPIIFIQRLMIWGRLAFHATLRIAIGTGFVTLASDAVGVPGAPPPLTGSLILLMCGLWIIIRNFSEGPYSSGWAPERDTNESIQKLKSRRE